MSGFIGPNLDDIRAQGRDDVEAKLPIRATLLPKSPLRVMSDNSAGLAFLVLLYLKNVADNLLPDQADLEWLQRWATIVLQDGQKPAAFATGTISLTGTIAGTLVPAGTTFQAGGGTVSVVFATTADTTIGAGPVVAPVRALTAGVIGNLPAGSLLGIVSGIVGLDATAGVVGLAGGVDAETVEELRLRVLDRLRNPPMGGDANDYVAWALRVAGVTRAWCSPNEVAIGTVTVRVMCDDLRATSTPSTNGFPLAGDLAAVRAYLDTVRPVTVKEFWVEAPIPEPIDYTVAISPDTASLRAATEVSVAEMLAQRAAPAYALNGVGQEAQTIYAAWVSDAILNTPGIEYLDLTMTDHVMPANGSMAVMGTVTYVG